MIDLFIQIRFLDIIDIILVAGLLYGLYRLLRGTAGLNIFIGIVAIFLVWQLVDVLQMELLSSILGAFSLKYAASFSQSAREPAMAKPIGSGYSGQTNASYSIRKPFPKPVSA